MMAGLFPGAPVDGAEGYSSILRARVISVDMKRYTVTVQTEKSGRKYTDLPVITPYAHFARGEGFYILPDIGAQCWIATEGSGGNPGIIGFTNLPKVTTVTEREGGEQPQEGDEALPSYGSRRPQRVLGEFGFTSRDGAFMHFRRGGIIELGGGGACQRLFLPLTNRIADVCENFKLISAAGIQAFETDRTDGSDGSTAKAIWRMMVKAGATDSETGIDGVTREASVLVEAGNLGNGRFRIVMAPVGIDLKDGSFVGELYRYEVDLNGGLTELAGGPGGIAHSDVLTASAPVVRACGQLDQYVNGTLNEYITGDRRTTMPAGTWHLRALSAIIDAAGGVLINGSITIAGNLSVSGFTTFGGMTTDINVLREFYNNHTHAGGPPPDPIWRVPTLPSP